MLRRASRVVLIDDEGRCLLFRYDERGAPLWVPPGGGLEGDEDHEAAAAREVREESGHAWPIGPRLGELVRWYTRRDGLVVRQHEVWYTARCPVHALDPERILALRAEGVLEGAWFDVPALATLAGVVPARLGELVADVLAGASPPAELGARYGPVSGPPAPFAGGAGGA